MIVGKERHSVLFDIINYSLLSLLFLSIAYPIYYLLMKSFSTYGGLNTIANPFMFVPAGFTVKSYEMFFYHKYIRSGYLVTIFRTVVGTTLSVVFTSMAAYALSKKKMPGRNFFTSMFLVTMFFQGGIIPTYLTVRDLGLLDNIWILVIMPLFNTYYMLILRSYFSTLPASLEESARIDGASDMGIFLKIIIPLSMPAIITVATWVFFTHWNSWFDSMLYITDFSKQVLQIHIRRLVIEQSTTMLGGVFISGGKANMPTEATVRATGIMVTIVPILLIYPFTKKFFTKGITLGAVKG